MTQAPKEHCDHECVCGVLMVGGIEGDKSPCNFSGCKHDTRSRPYPAPTDEQAMIIGMLEAEVDRLTDIEQKAASEAREQVLEEALQAVDQIAVIYGIDDQLRTHLSESIESLRQHKGGTSE